MSNSPCNDPKIIQLRSLAWEQPTEKLEALLVKYQAQGRADISYAIKSVLQDRRLEFCNQ
ncbi:MAG: hypothetical protein H0U60_13225 [Blastocatellia bacterium]|nr:hypothetical protein [Blastocatellia bacterium]